MDVHWIVLLIAVVPLWLLQNIVHELSHGLALWFGWKWSFKIWPFPSTKLGRFTFAHVTYQKTEESKEVSDKGWALVSIMPRIVNVALITILMIPCILISDRAIVMPFLVFMWTNFIDMCVGLLSSLKTPNTTSDIWKFQSRLDIPINYLRYSCVGICGYHALVILLITLARLI